MHPQQGQNQSSSEKEHKHSMFETAQIRNRIQSTENCGAGELLLTGQKGIACIKMYVPCVSADISHGEVTPQTLYICLLGQMGLLRYQNQGERDVSHMADY